MSASAGGHGPILLVGAAGQVGAALAPRLARLGSVICATRADVDLEQEGAIRALVARVAPSVIVNAAAYTAVDEAEHDADRCARLNADAPAVLAAEADRLGATLVHFSTNYVFDGRRDGAYHEDDPTSPLSVYGATKLEGEQRVAAATPRHLIFRTAAVYGREGRNFMRRMLELSRERNELRVVDDQFIAPTPAWLVAEAVTAAMPQIGARDGPRGIHHLTTTGSTSWYAFARRILERSPEAGSRRARSIVPVDSSQFPTPARRPSNGVLDVSRYGRAFGRSLPTWEEAFERTVTGDETWNGA